jgi:Ni,Fe-hydrogenase III small subunit
MFDKLITESMGKSPWLFHINAGSCNGCDIELVAVLTPRYDAERLGFKLAGSPRQADIVVVTGPITKQSLPRVLRAISQVPEPRCIVTMHLGSGTWDIARSTLSSDCLVTGPVTTTMSAWRGLPTSLKPSLSASKRGVRTETSSMSQPLQEPALMWNSHGDFSVLS